jgi:hypothetical protein
MKKIMKPLAVLFIAALVLLFANCGGGGNEAAPEKVALEQLKKTWTIASSNGAKLGTQDRTGDFTGFTLTFSGSFNSGSPSGPYTFTVGGTRPTPSPWPASGSWNFAGEPSKNNGSIVRINDGIGIVYSINSSGQLTLQFTCSDCTHDGSAKTSQVNGTWTFVMN